MELNTTARPSSMLISRWFPVYFARITTNPLRNIEKGRSIALSSIGCAGFVPEAKLDDDVDVWNAFPVISYRRRSPAGDLKAKERSDRSANQLINQSHDHRSKDDQVNHNHASSRPTRVGLGMGEVHVRT